MSIEEIKKEVRAFISKAKTDDALNIIEVWANQNGSQDACIAIDLLKADWATLKRESNMGFAENVTQRTANINYRILSFNWDVKSTPTVMIESVVGAGGNTNQRSIETANTTRDGLRIPQPNDTLIANNRPIIVRMVEEARSFTPFMDIKIPIKILFLAATPRNVGQLNTGRESRFKDLVRLFDDEKRFLFKEEHGVTTEDFQNFLIFEDPHIVHYGGHGLTEGIVLEDAVLEADILSGIFQLSNKTQCVILNACRSLAIARTLAEHIPYVVGTQSVIDDRTAIAFARGFYVGIVANKTIEQAFQNGVLTVKREKLPDADVLVLVKGER